MTEVSRKVVISLSAFALVSCDAETNASESPGSGGSSADEDSEGDEENGGERSGGERSGGAGGVAVGSGGVAVGSGGVTAGAGAGGSLGGSASLGSQGSGGAGAPPGPTACKRGVSYGYHSKADLQALSPGVSWWYNWALRPDEAVRDGSYLNYGVEFVPMVWGASFDRASAVADIPTDASTLLGFNEPNFGAQANLSAQEAAELWPELEQIAEERDLRLVSPAVNYCGGDCQDTDPFRYLEEFFTACQGCRVDALAIHIYVGCSPSGESKAQWLIDHVENYKARFKHPLWLTEFACDDAQNAEQQRAFLKDAVAYLEKEPRIERYAWFAGRAENVPHVDLLGEDGELTELGEAYVNAPTNADCTR